MPIVHTICESIFANPTPENIQCVILLKLHPNHEIAIDIDKKMILDLYKRHLNKGTLFDEFFKLLELGNPLREIKIEYENLVKDCDLFVRVCERTIEKILVVDKKECCLINGGLNRIEAKDCLSNLASAGITIKNIQNMYNSPFGKQEM